MENNNINNSTGNVGNTNVNNSAPNGNVLKNSNNNIETTSINNGVSNNLGAAVSNTSEPVIVQSTTAPNTSNSGSNDNIINENLKKVEINYTPPSKAKTTWMVLIFVLLIAFVIFLPNINNFFNQYKDSKNVPVQDVIESGKLECKLNSNTENLDMSYLRVFKYTENKLESASYTITTKGDVSLDEKTLNDISDKCKLLANNTKKISGIEIDCTQTEGKVVEKQSFVFGNIDSDKLDAAFSEAGGTYPEFEAGQDINSIEKTMNAAGYTCTRMR